MMIVPAAEGGSQAKPATFLANVFSDDVTWSPDGTYLLFNTSQRTEEVQVARVTWCRTHRAFARMNSAIFSAKRRHAPCLHRRAKTNPLLRHPRRLPHRRSPKLPLQMLAARRRSRSPFKSFGTTFAAG